MKHSFLFLFFLITSFLNAQNYHPFPTRNAMWTEMYFNPYPYEYSEFHSFALKDNDTTINGKRYHKLYHSMDTTFTEADLCGAIREENKKIYYYSIVSLSFPNSGSSINSYMTIESKKEVILCDFSLNIGDTLKSDSIRLVLNSEMVVEKIDSIVLGSEYRKIYTFAYPDLTPHLVIPWAQWVEGIGHLRGLLFKIGDVPTNGLWNDLICFKEGNSWLYHYSDKYTDCFYKTDAVIKIPNESDITIAPNPIYESATVNFKENHYKKLLMLDLLGRNVREYNLEGRSSLIIHREGLVSGVYILSFLDNNGEITSSKVILK